MLEEMGFATARISLEMDACYQKCFTEVHNESGNATGTACVTISCYVNITKHD